MEERDDGYTVERTASIWLNSVHSLCEQTVCHQ